MLIQFLAKLHIWWTDAIEEAAHWYVWEWQPKFKQAIKEIRKEKNP